MPRQCILYREFKTRTVNIPRTKYSPSAPSIPPSACRDTTKPFRYVALTMISEAFRRLDTNLGPCLSPLRLITLKMGAYRAEYLLQSIPRLASTMESVTFNGLDFVASYYCTKKIKAVPRRMSPFPGPSSILPAEEKATPPCGYYTTSFPLLCLTAAVWSKMKLHTCTCCAM